MARCVLLVFGCLFRAWTADAAACTPDPCLNGATCTEETPDVPKCTCAAGYEGDLCQTDIDDCIVGQAATSAGTPVCDNDGKCTDLVNDFECECPFGFGGRKCQIVENFTLQQWKGSVCDGTPWRCFRLQMNRCIKTGLMDGNVGERDMWYGKLQLGEDGKYVVDLCWGEKDDEEELCKCDNHFTAIPKLGKNSLGPPTPGVHDSDSCHKLKRITSSRLVNSSGVKADDDDPNFRNVDCASPDSAWRVAAYSPVVLVAFFAALIQL